MYDKYHRPHHTIYDNAGKNAKGSYCDTLEVALSDLISEDQKKTLQQLYTDFFSEKQLAGVYWPDDGLRCTIEFKPGYYALDDLKTTLEQAGFELALFGSYYSARYDEANPEPHYVDDGFH